MATKKEAERHIRSLTHTWFAALLEGRKEHPDFTEFKSWLRAQGYGHLLEFRSVMGPDEDAERWFDDELGQSWRR